MSQIVNRLLNAPSGSLLALWFLSFGCVVMWSPRTTVVMVGIAVLVLAGLRIGLRPPSVRLAWDSVAFFGLVVLWLAAGALWSVSDSALSRAGQLMGLAALAVVAIGLSQALTRADFEMAVRGLLLGGAAFASIMAFELATDLMIYRAVRGLGDGAAVDPNALNRPEVLASLFLWPVAGALWLMGWRWASCSLPVVFLALTTALPSQSATLGTILGLIVFGGAIFAWHWFRWVLILAILAMVLLAVPVAGWMAASGLTEADWVEFSAKHRVVIWEYTADRIAERPWFGWGLDASRVLNQLGPGLEWRSSVELLPLHPHNAVLQIWLELGAYGAMAALMFLLGLVGQIDRVPEQARPFAAGLFATSIGIGLTAFGLWQSWWLAGIIASVAGIVVLGQASRARRSCLP